MAKSPKKDIAKKATPEKKKRGPSSFIIFSSEQRPVVIKKFGFEKKDIGPIGKKLGELWGELSEAEKQVYKDKAASKAK